MASELEESNDEKIMNYFRLKQDYFEERRKIINKLYKKTKFVESTNEKKRIALKEEITESDVINAILSKMHKIKKSRGFKMGNTHNLEDLLESQFKKVEVLKEHIINLKLDLLFNYKSEDDALAEITVKIPEFNRQLEVY
jgi:valyl-tRNA synthetase